MSKAELRIPMPESQTLRVQIAADDPYWREKALANLDPLSPAAVAIRRSPMTAAERAAWDDYCRLQDRIDDLRRFTACLRELEGALRDLGALA